MPVLEPGSRAITLQIAVLGSRRGESFRRLILNIVHFSEVLQVSEIHSLHLQTAGHGGYAGHSTDTFRHIEPVLNWLPFFEPPDWAPVAISC